MSLEVTDSGGLSDTDQVTVTVTSDGDTPPTTGITSPGEGETVSGTVAVTASASLTPSAGLD